MFCYGLVPKRIPAGLASDRPDGQKRGDGFFPPVEKTKTAINESFIIYSMGAKKGPVKKSSPLFWPSGRSEARPAGVHFGIKPWQNTAFPCVSFEFGGYRAPASPDRLKKTIRGIPDRMG